jgi:two-component system sensor histidine kinase HupT/HoxJ
MAQLHQLLVNLIQNARDAMENVAHPRLILSAERSDEIVTIHVIDQGVGISEQDAKTIFDPFFSSKPVGQGTGLGLYVSYGLAHDLKGDLSFKNNPKGGAEFILSLPVDRMS